MKKLRKIKFIALLLITVMQFAFVPVQKAQAYSNPATVPLLSVSNFTALAASTITSPTGPTVLNNGDLGSNGVCTNFIAPCTGPINGTIVGGTIQLANTAATTGQTDATAAVTNANGRVADTTIASGLLNGLTLTQGVYDVPFAVTNLTGDLTLSGDANSVFIFRAASSLITASTSRVLLTGGVQACHVFWTVGSQATFDGTTQFVGTVFAQSSIVFTAGGATLAGRAIAQTAAITFRNTTVNNSTCAAASTTTAAPTFPNTGIAPDKKSDTLWNFILPTGIVVVLYVIYIVRKKRAM